MGLMFDVGGDARMLTSQLRWLIRLRWIAGLVAIVGGLVNHWWLGWFDHAMPIVAVGGVILTYNTMLYWLSNCRRFFWRKRHIQIAWIQILLDMGCLANLTIWTGGANSPILGFFVFHMVFASLLLRRSTAFGMVAMAVGLEFVNLKVAGQIPTSLSSRLLFGSWGLTLLFTVYLANHITLMLRSHYARLLEQHRRNRMLTRQLREQQQSMVQHEKMAAIGQLAAGVAHEIANPLASMDGILQLAQRKPQRMDAERVGHLRHQVQRIMQIVQKLTGFAHPSDYQWEVVDLFELVEQAVQMVKYDPRSKGIPIEVQLRSESGRIRVQPHAMEQVLLNLLINALDALEQTPSPSLRVCVDCTGAWWRIRVIDNGSGIDPTHKDRIFDPFFTTKPVGKGTGLGLAICYRLIQDQGGRIEVTSRPDQGTTMAIYLPHTTEAS